MKKYLQNGGLIVAGSLAGVTTASAALPAIVATTMTNLETDGLALIDLIWPVVGGITVGFILLKLFKRGANKV